MWLYTAMFAWINFTQCVDQRESWFIVYNLVGIISEQKGILEFDMLIQQKMTYPLVINLRLCLCQIYGMREKHLGQETSGWLTLNNTAIELFNNDRSAKKINIRVY